MLPIILCINFQGAEINGQQVQQEQRNRNPVDKNEYGGCQVIEQLAYRQ